MFAHRERKHQLTTGERAALWEMFAPAETILVAKIDRCSVNEHAKNIPLYELMSIMKECYNHLDICGRISENRPGNFAIMFLFYKDEDVNMKTQLTQFFNNYNVRSYKIDYCIDSAPSDKQEFLAFKLNSETCECILNNMRIFIQNTAFKAF